MIWVGVFLHLATVVGFLLGTLLIAHFIRQRRPPSDSVAWLLLIVLIPYVGLPLFLVLGGRKLRAMARRKRSIDLGPIRDGTRAPGPLERLWLAQGIPPATDGNLLRLQSSGEESYAALAELIAGAGRSIHISMYLLQPDAVGREVLAQLAARAAAGVKVRLLLDGVGSRHVGRRTLAPLLQAGGAVAFFMPIWRRPFRRRANLRNHRKYAIADDLRVLAGGANVGQEYIGPLRRAERWHDLTFTLEGPGVASYVEVFRSDWGFASREWIRVEPPPQPHYPKGAGAQVQIVPSGPDVPGDPLPDALLTLAVSARQRMWIVTPYFVPDDALCRALSLAAHRGVDVRVLVPHRSDHWLADLAGRGYLREIRNAGGTILHFPSMLHAKAVLSDDQVAILGSANVDMRSLLLNYEAGLFVYSAAEIEAVERWMESLVQQAHPALRRTGALGELVEGLARLFAPQL
jgi:cardiolipin synthase